MKARATAALLVPLVAVALAASACGSDKPACRPPRVAEHDRRGCHRQSRRTASPPTRCAANKAAGKITYLSSFDFAASPSIVDVVMAEQAGLLRQAVPRRRPQVQLLHGQLPARGRRPGPVQPRPAPTPRCSPTSTGRRPLRGVADYGKSNIDALLVRDDGQINQLSDLKGKTIGVKGALPPAVVAMLNKAGLVAGQGLQGRAARRLRPGGPPPAGHRRGCPCYKSNEPGQLDRAGIPYKLFDPSADGIPGTFGILYTSAAVPERPPDGRAGLRAGLAARAWPTPSPTRPPRSPPRVAAHQGRRQQELPVRGGRDVPLAGRVEAGRRRHAKGELPSA